MAEWSDLHFSDHNIDGKLCRVCPAHVVHREHDDSRNCWCHPEVARPCPECEEVTGKRATPMPGCWQCGGRGLVTVTDVWEIDHHDGSYPLLLIHAPD